MARVLERINEIANTYIKINSAVMGERETGLRQVIDIVNAEKPEWTEMTDMYFPRWLEECPNYGCYEAAGFESFDSVSSLDMTDVVVTHVEKDAEALEHLTLEPSKSMKK